MSAAGEQAGDTVVASGVTRPPVLFLTGLVLGLALELVLPLPLAFAQIALISWMAGGGLTLIGAAIVAAGARNFSRAATPVPSNEPVRWSLPGYTAARSPWILILALPLVVLLRYGVVAREECYLERRFGAAYRDYKANVRRWL